MSVPRRLLLLWALCLAAAACGDDDDTPTRAGQKAEDPSEALAQRVGEGDPLEVLAVLARPHAEVREQLGPHSLVCTSKLTLAPTRPPDPNPKLDTPVPADQSIGDEVALRWDAPDDAGPRFALEQHNDADRGRSVVVLDGTQYAKLEHRPWTFHALESDVYELWLDDAWRTGHDAVEFLLPGASVSAQPAPGEGWDGGDALRMTFEPGDGPVPGPQGGWRSKVAFSALSGTLLIDLATGAWLSIDASATYTVEGGAGGPLAGTFEVHGRLAPSLPQAPAVAAPKDAVALPERHRYEEDRKRLLDGLAAP